MELMVRLNRDEIQKTLQYDLIAETVLGSRWETGTRKRLQNGFFSTSETKMLTKIKRLANEWSLKKGVPNDGYAMTVEEYNLWNKFAAFCKML